MMLVREARAEELPAVFRLGYDAWGAGKPLDEYLAECSYSRKYRKGRWFALERDGALASALIVYRGEFGLPRHGWGIGSLATAPALRGQGLASALLRELLAQEAGTSFLFADISPDFYRGFGFVELPAPMQRRPGSMLMARGELPADFAPPDYF